MEDPLPASTDLGICSNRMSNSKQLALSLAEALERLGAVNEQLGLGWARLLQVGTDSPDLFLGVAIFYGKFLELRARISESQLSERAKGLYVGAINQLLMFAAPTQLGSLTTGQLAQHHDKIDLLHLAADALPGEFVADVQPTTLEELCKELEQILASLTDADIEPELRRVISNSLETLLMVLRSYKILGPEGAAKAYGCVAAELARIMHQSQPASKAGKSALQKTIALAKKIGAVVIWTSAVVGGADKLLTDGTDIAKFVTGPDQATHNPGSDGHDR